MSPAPKLGIIAGGGAAPRLLIDVCRRQGRAIFVVCLEGQADTDLARDDVPHLWLPLGAALRLKEALATQQVRELVMLGRVRRPSLLDIKPDMLALKVLTRIGVNALGDDGLLRAIGKAMEDECGVRVIGAQDVFADMLTPHGHLGRLKPDHEALQDIARGLDAARTLGALDIGQAVVVQQGIVLGVEAAEGTDALLARAGTLRRSGPGGVLVKIAKPQQDTRFDLPTVGPETIAAAAAAGLRGVALEAGRSLLILREKTVAQADEAGLFVVGVAVSDGKA